MAHEELIKKRIYNAGFKEERGRDDVVKIDTWNIHNGELLKIVFEEINSKWRQGVWMLIDGGILINGILCPSASIW